MANRWTSPSRLHSNLLKFRHFRELSQRQPLSRHTAEQHRRFLARCYHELLTKSRVSLCNVRPCRLSSSSSVDVEKKKMPISPYHLVEDKLASLSTAIKKHIETNSEELKDLAGYYFDGQGKLFRPMVVMLVARTFNAHLSGSENLLQSQEQIAMISEMIHTASLMHDDVIDHADTRRGKPSINSVWGQRKAILAGDYVMAMASMLLAQVRHEEVVSIVSQITEDLVRGEFMQLGSKENETERFTHYLTKTFKKTASLLANSCKAVAVLGECDEDLAETAYQYGRNLGISFQLVDDLLDFTSCDHVMGKPTAADLKLGLATAPVLFASQEFPELHAMIMRRFSEEGDVETARELVAKSDGEAQTKLLAEEHSKEAIRLIRTLRPSSSSLALEVLARKVLSRQK